MGHLAGKLLATRSETIVPTEIEITKKQTLSRVWSVFVFTVLYSGCPHHYNKYMRTTQRKGDIAVSQAVATFTKLGFDVSIPLTESAAYDLIVDHPDGLKRVQVRYSGFREVDLRRIHSNSSGYVIKKVKKNAYDWLYVLKNTGEEYLLQDCLHTRRSFTPKPQYLLSNILKSIIPL